MRRTNPIIRAVYDKGPSYLDRYTIVFNMRHGKFWDCLAASTSGDAQRGTCSVGAHLGRRISLSSLPKTAMPKVQQALESYAI